MGMTYPPVGHYQTLSWSQKRERRDVGSDLLEQVQWLRGDPRLSSWEEGFLASIARMLQETHGTVSISPKQWNIIRQINVLVETDPLETETESLE